MAGFDPYGFDPYSFAEVTRANDALSTDFVRQLRERAAASQAFVEGSSFDVEHSNARDVENRLAACINAAVSVPAVETRGNVAVIASVAASRPSSPPPPHLGGRKRRRTLVLSHHLSCHSLEHQMCASHESLVRQNRHHGLHRNR